MASTLVNDPGEFRCRVATDAWLGQIMTAMPAVNAIPAVVSAAPGIATYNDLPLTLPRMKGLA